MHGHTAILSLWEFADNLLVVKEKTHGDTLNQALLGKGDTYGLVANISFLVGIGSDNVLLLSKFIIPFLVITSNTNWYNIITSHIYYS